MKIKSIDIVMGILAGVLLSLMIYCNSIVAKGSTPLSASWFAHLVGMVVAFFLIILFARKSNTIHPENKMSRAPFGAYLGGIPGALTVVLASITVNGSLKLSSSIALMLVGQVFFGVLVDVLGWFGIFKRKLALLDYSAILLILIGSIIVVVFRP